MDKLNNLTGNYGNINNLDDFLAQSDALKNPENLTKIDNDPELKADLQGLIEKNQDFDNDTAFGDSGITPGEIANKFSDVLGNYINNVNAKNRDAEKAVETFVSGGNIDMHSVMIAAEKAKTTAQAEAPKTLEERIAGIENKLMSENNPNVMIVMGSVRILSTGLMMRVMTDHTTATRSIVVHPPV